MYVWYYETIYVCWPGHISCRMYLLQNIDRFLGTSANTSTTATPRATPPISSEDEKVESAFQFL